ncbi:Glycosyltransferase involved in cell wall bisynthesis [Haladaptatus litoreus]|uniref:Glycosyltransferase involved in cell wall bisynthesis n=1 Tax=Haladaptatus litoreus TaxID=553468 RepID=A0A1N6YSN6_9EURY|nr:glycosyltransferase family 2 protein [Haladaptatus litoreus]SIR17678.1 Glycosyltransferase involved in cell wall bisynthesis [Haladaptatus litoreus]
MPEIPLVSVVIATYNRPKRVIRAVESVLDQTYSNIQLIVVDDSDKYNEAVAEIDNVRYIYHGDPCGLSHARNEGIRSANGKYVAFLDDDDQWLKTKLEKQVTAIQNRDVELCTCWRYMVWENGNIRNVAKTDIDGDVVKKLLCRNVVGPPSGVIVSKHALEIVGNFSEQFPLWEDREWYLRVALEFKIGCVEEPLVKYAIDSPNKMSGNFETAKTIAYPRLLKKYDAVVDRHGGRFVSGWKYRKFGKMAHDAGNRPRALYYATQAIVAYPFEWPFYRLFIRSLVGERGYSILESTIDTISSSCSNINISKL